MKIRMIITALFGFILPLGSFAMTYTWEDGKTRCMPNFNNEKQTGYLCTQIENGSVYQKIGIQKGDVVITINGEPMNADLDHAMVQWQAFKKVSAGIIVVERNGKQVVLKSKEKFDGYFNQLKDIN